MAARLTAFLVSAIVAVTFVAGLIVGAQREDDGGPADLIIHNARVYLGASTEAAEAVAIRDGKIVRVGSNKEIDRLRRRQTLDADGGTVVAGLNDAGANLLAADAADLPRAQRLEQLKKAIDEAHRLGLTSVQTMVASADDLALLNELKKNKALKLRVQVALAATLPLTEESAAALDTLRKQAAAEANATDTPALLKVNAVKLTLGAPADATRSTQKVRTTMRKPATDQVAQLADAITRLDREHWQVIVSATTASDAAIALDAFEQAFGTQAAAAIRARRHRVDISTPLDATQTARLGALELIPSLPATVAAALAATPAARLAAQTDQTLPTIPAATLPPSATDAPEATKAPATNALATATTATAATAAVETNAAAANVATKADSAAPSTAADSGLATLAEMLLANPLVVIRGDTLADPMTVIAAAAAAAEPLDAMAAIIDAYTSRAAYASHEDTAKGTIAKDQAADLVILSTDLFAAPTDRPLTVTVSATIVNGEVVFTRPAPARPAATDNN